MEHNDIRHKLSEYIERSLTDRERSDVEIHLRTCDQCSRALAELQKTIEHIKSVEEIDPPAWMTQKIMAKVRAEAEERKGLFHRIFYPLAIKLPIQAIAVLFLTITVFYVYQNAQLSQKGPETPIAEFADERPASQKSKPKDQLAKADASAKRSYHAPQSPEYKSLDMKLEYEKPSPPALQGRGAAPASAPARPAEPSMPAGNGAESKKDAAAVPSAAPSPVREQTRVAQGTIAQLEDKEQSYASARKAKSVQAMGKGADCLSYAPAVVIVSGTIHTRNFPTQTDPARSTSDDKQGPSWIFTLDKTRCVAGDTVHAGEPSLSEMQLVLDAAQSVHYRTLLTQPVIITGTLIHASSSSHHTSVLLQVQTIKARTQEEQTPGPAHQ